MGSPESTQGTVEFKVGEEKFTTWYRVFGDLKTSKRRPLVVLHGGPGIPSFYLEPFSDLTVSHGIPVIIYDQLGCGNSTHLKNKPASFWTEALFMDELDNLLAHLGVTENFDLAGHSWGGMLGSRYAGSRQPNGLKHLILANSLATLKAWVESNLMLLKQLPQDVQDIVNKHEADGSTDAQEYHDALAKFFDKFICRINPHPEGVAKSEAGLASDPTVNKTMWGPAWLRGGGTLKDWTVVEDLPNIKASTLMFNGEFDQAQDFVVAPFFKYIPRIKWIRLNNSSHMSHYEVRDEVMQLIADFVID